MLRSPTSDDADEDQGKRTGDAEPGRSGRTHRPIPMHFQLQPYRLHEQGDARHGDTVIADIINYPTDKRPPVGKIVKVVQKPEDPSSEVEVIIEEFGLPKRFPRTVHEEARMLSTGGREGSREKRRALRKLATVTIDGERARDFDDAVSVALTEHGFRLWVHIADVGAYVDWDSAIDLEVRERGTSVYFPDRVIPMLPQELSEELCSLKPEMERLWW